MPFKYLFYLYWCCTRLTLRSDSSPRWCQFQNKHLNTDENKANTFSIHIAQRKGVNVKTWPCVSIGASYWKWLVKLDKLFIPVQIASLILLLGTSCQTNEIVWSYRYWKASPKEINFVFVNLWRVILLLPFGVRSVLYYSKKRCQQTFVSSTLKIPWFN